MSKLKSLLKSTVKSHTRTLKSGRVVNVRQYNDKRTKKDGVSAVKTDVKTINGSATSPARPVPKKQTEVNRSLKKYHILLDQDSTPISNEDAIALKSYFSSMAKIHNIDGNGKNGQLKVSVGKGISRSCQATYTPSQVKIRIRTGTGSSLPHEFCHYLDHEHIQPNKIVLKKYEKIAKVLRESPEMRAIRYDSDSEYHLKDSEMLARLYEQWMNDELSRKDNGSLLQRQMESENATITEAAKQTKLSEFDSGLWSLGMAWGNKGKLGRLHDEMRSAARKYAPSYDIGRIDTDEKYREKANKDMRKSKNVIMGQIEKFADKYFFGYIRGNETALGKYAAVPPKDFEASMKAYEEKSGNKGNKPLKWRGPYFSPETRKKAYPLLEKMLADLDIKKALSAFNTFGSDVTSQQILKSTVKAHTRTLKSGAISNVREYTDKRIKKENKITTPQQKVAGKQDTHNFDKPSIEDYKKEFPNDPLRFILAATVYGLLDKSECKNSGYMSNRLGFIITPESNTETMLLRLNSFAKQQYAQNKNDERNGITPICPKSTSNLLGYCKGWLSVGGLNHDFLEDYAKVQDKSSETIIANQWKYAQKHFSDDPIVAKAKDKQKRTAEMTDQQIAKRVEEKLGKPPESPSKPSKPTWGAWRNKNGAGDFMRKLWAEYYQKVRKYNALLAKYNSDIKAYEERANKIKKDIKDKEAKRSTQSKS